MTPVISVENLSKVYHLGQIGTGTFSRDLELWFARLRGKPNPFLKIGQQDHGNQVGEDLWALRDVSFTVEQGEVLGIIGRNGAGKSTLLKILSRVTAPTSGRVRVKGRIASLLEVGTGFHPELTGRENVYLNGAILGMTRAEVDRKFDEIVDFAGVEKFIDTPVKRYSSGMYVRLAFAVAAHLEPEILLVDEVLAVGDAEFQKKCLGKMGDVAEQGRTILFVSHQLNAIKSLCQTTALINKGELIKLGSTEEVLRHYIKTESINTEWKLENNQASSSKYFAPLRFSLINKDGKIITEAASADEEIGVLIQGAIEFTDISLTIGFAVYSTDGDLLFWSNQTDTQQETWPQLHKGINQLVAWLPKHFLNEGEYRIELMASLHYREWICKPGFNSPSIKLSIKGGLSQSPYWMMKRPGLLAPIIQYVKYNQFELNS